MTRRWRPHLLLLFVLALALPGAAHAQPAPQQQFSGAPEALRAYLIKAREAESIADPLARCLAIPELPGNAWAVGLGQAHCMMAHEPNLTFDEFKSMVERKAFGELEARFRSDLDRHFTPRSSEVIHFDFEIFEDSKSEALTQRWLEQAPESPFAMVARAVFLRYSAWEARGGKWASDTADIKFEHARMLAGAASTLLSKALEREPRLIHAHAEQLNVALLTSDDSLRRRTFFQVAKLDPLCRQITNQVMASLQPRWGGSYEQMEAYAKTLVPYLATRPLVASTIASIPVDKASYLRRENEHTKVIELLKPVTLVSSYTIVFQELATSMGLAGDKEPWQALAYLVQQSRFVSDFAPLREQGRVLSLLGEHEWAAITLEKAVKIQPQDDSAQLMLAYSSLQAKRYAAAEKASEVLLSVPERRTDALRMLLENMMLTERVEKALEYAEILNKEQPTLAAPWFARSLALNRLKRPGAREALQRFVETADPQDPWESAMMVQAKAWLEK